MKRVMAMIAVLGMAFSLSACAGATRQEKGTAIGAGVGAGVGAALGQAIGRNTEATLIGTGVGAVVGGIAGNQIGAYMDRQEAELRQVLAASDAASVQRSQDVLTAIFRSEVMFDFDSAVLKPGAYTEIDRVAGVLERYPQTTIRVEGHTDATGTEAYNQKLSERRADAVAGALVREGIDPHRIQAVGYGESLPVSSNDALNRRVNIVITPIARG